MRHSQMNLMILLPPLVETGVKAASTDRYTLFSQVERVYDKMHPSPVRGCIYLKGQVKVGFLVSEEVRSALVCPYVQPELVRNLLPWMPECQELPPYR